MQLRAGHRRVRPSPLAALVFAVVLAAAAGGALALEHSHQDQEARALAEHAPQVAAVFDALGSRIVATLGMGVHVAEFHREDPALFEGMMGEEMLTSPLASLTLLARGQRGSRPQKGYVPVAAAGRSRARLLPEFEPGDWAKLSQLVSEGGVRVVKLAWASKVVVVGLAAARAQGDRAVYAELVVPRAATSVFEPEGMEYALYFGPEERPETLLYASIQELPLPEPRVREQISLGSEQLLLVLSAPHGLVGGVAHLLPWLVLGLGALSAAGSALLVEALRRRAAAEASRRALAEQNERLRGVDRVKDEFVAAVSHDLRTPLTSIFGYLALLEEEGGLSDGQRRYLEVIGRNSRRLLALVDDLLFLARADAQRLDLRVDPLDLRALVEEGTDAHRPAAAAAGVALSAHAEELPVFLGDHARLAQLVDNLLSNAIKFTPEGGRVEVALSRTEDGLVLAVSDTGVGIPAADLEHVFDRFFRSAPAGSVPGTGLGLAIVRTIAEAHGGTVSVASAVGAGTTFHVELPVREAPPSPVEPVPERLLAEPHR